MRGSVQRAAFFALLSSAAFWSVLILAPFFQSTSIAVEQKPDAPRRGLSLPVPAPPPPPGRLLAHRAVRLAPLDAGELGSLPPAETRRVQSAASLFDRFMSTEIPAADGFDFPVGDPDGGGAYRDPATGREHPGWYVSVRFGEQYAYGIHPAEDWNGAGLSNTDLGQPVHAVAGGRVVFAEEQVKPTGGIVIIQHCYYEGAEQKRIRSVYKHVDDIRVQAGQDVERRQIIGLIGRDADKRFAAHLHLEMRFDESLSPTFWPSARKKSLAWIREHYADPSAFIRAHRLLHVPHDEEQLVLVDATSGAARLYRRGEVQLELSGRFGRRAEDRRRMGLATKPQGVYFVVGRRQGQETPWHEINFPNPSDAAKARREGLLSPQREARVLRAWQERRSTRRSDGEGRAYEGLAPRWDRLKLQTLDGKPLTVAQGSMFVIF